MTTYLGRPGDLQALNRTPARGYDNAPDLGAHVHRLLSGTQVVDRTARAARTWSMQWRWMTRADRRRIMQLAGGYLGPGPWVLIEPDALNVLTANQSSGTDARGDTTGYATVDPASPISSTTDQAAAGLRSLQWAVAASPSASTAVRLTHPGMPGWAVPAGTTWTFQSNTRRKSGGVTGSRVLASLRWLDATGAQVGTDVDGTPVAPNSTSGWGMRPTVTATAPAGAVYVVPQIKPVFADITSATTFYFDQLQLELGASASTYEPGEVQPLVSFADVSRSVVVTPYADVGVTLVEVTPS